ncbi:MAG: Alkyl hydroperoxide reductase subunit C-like protein, partial [uncultured Thermomicrobiales bacterium]
GRVGARARALRGGGCPGPGHQRRSRPVAHRLRRLARRPHLSPPGRLPSARQRHPRLRPLASRARLGQTGALRHRSGRDCPVGTGLGEWSGRCLSITDVRGRDV